MVLSERQLRNIPAYAQPNCSCTGERLIFVQCVVCDEVIRLACGSCYQQGSPLSRMRHIIDFCKYREKKDVHNAV